MNRRRLWLKVFAIGVGIVLGLALYFFWSKSLSSPQDDIANLERATPQSPIEEEVEAAIRRAEKLSLDKKWSEAEVAYRDVQKKFGDAPFGPSSSATTESAEALAAIQCLRARENEKKQIVVFEDFWNQFLKNLSEQNIQALIRSTSCRFAVAKSESDVEFDIDRSTGIPLIAKSIQEKEWRPASWGNEKYHVFESDSAAIGFIEEDGMWRWKSYISFSEDGLQQFTWAGKAFQVDQSGSSKSPE